MAQHLLSKPHMATKKPNPPKRKTTPRTRAQSPTVGMFMTASVHTIRAGASLADAHRLMNRHRIRHLPVLEQGELIGILSQRDLYLLEAIDHSQPSEMRVEEAMTRDVFATTPQAPLRIVLRTMIDKKLGSAVVIRAGQTVGVFTAIDAMQALLDSLPG
jgi:acetoin utilization protein AcuB